MGEYLLIMPITIDFDIVRAIVSPQGRSWYFCGKRDGLSKKHDHATIKCSNKLKIPPVNVQQASHTGKQTESRTRAARVSARPEIGGSACAAAQTGVSRLHGV